MGNGCARLPSTERSNCTAQLTGAQHNIQFIHIKCSNADLKKKKSVTNTCRQLRSVLKQPCCSGAAGGKVSLMANWSWSPNRDSGIRQNRERMSAKVQSTAVRENFLQGRSTSLCDIQRRSPLSHVATGH